MARTYTVHAKDTNEEKLVKAAARCGAQWIKGAPLDGWVWVNRWGTWVPVEVKLPERAGKKREFTEAQLKFFEWCRDRSAKYFVWRTEADVLRDIGGKL